MFRPLTALVLTAIATAAEPVALAAISNMRLRNRVAELPAASQAIALKVFAKNPGLLADAEHLGISPSGGVYYINCPCRAKHAAPPATVPAAGRPVWSAATIPVSNSAAYAYNSRPGAPNTLYLDFDGEVVTGTSWNLDPDGAGPLTATATYTAVAFSRDGDLANFTDAEQDAIYLIWQRVAEDYRPFNVNVTTVRPTAAGVLGGPRISWALITRSTDQSGANCPAHNAGGVAYIDGFGDANLSPAWVYYDNLPLGGPPQDDYIAEAASHEVGHNMSLRHDGTPADEYYAGHGSPLSWGPIMGASYDMVITQWSRCEFANARNGYYDGGGNWVTIPTQDDLALITSRLGLVPDVVDGPLTDSTTLTVLPGSRTVTPFNSIIYSDADADLYSFTCAAGAATFTITPKTVTSLGFLTPATPGANLDVQADILDSGMNVVFSHSPTDNINATVAGALPSAGTYYLRVRGSGNRNPLNDGFSSYGSIGQYNVSGSIPPAAPGSLQLTSTVLTQMEGSRGPRTITLTVTRSAGSGGAVSVNYATADLSTTAGSDYTAVSGTLSWADGDPPTQVIAIVIDGDAAEEPDEAFTVTLSAPTGGASLGANTTVMVALRNDDGASAALAESSAASIQAGGTGDDTSCGAGAITGLLLGIGGLGLMRRRRR
jgi:hypothetical protein